jgi:hypothetical protein
MPKQTENRNAHQTSNLQQTAPVNNLSITCEQRVNNPQPATRGTKLRMPRDLYRRAQQCADAVSEPVGRWLFLASRHQSGDAPADCSNTAADRDPLQPKTSPTDVIATLSGPAPAIPTADLLARIARVCTWCEARRPKPFKTHLREGVDYLVANTNDE